MYKKIKLFYDKGLWTSSMVKQATEKGLLSYEEYEAIVGKGVING